MEAHHPRGRIAGQQRDLRESERLEVLGTSTRGPRRRLPCQVRVGARDALRGTFPHSSRFSFAHSL